MTNHGINQFMFGACVIFGIWLFFKLWDYVAPYFLKTDNIVMFTGSAGSGKTFFGVRYAIKQYQKALNQHAMRKAMLYALYGLKTAFHFTIAKLFKRLRSRPRPALPVIEPKPLLFSNLPIKYKDKFCSAITPDLYKNLYNLPSRSVVFIDEIGQVFGNFDYDKKKDKKLARFDDFVRLYRHITLGGYLIMTDQSIENCSWVIKRRVGTIYNLHNFKKLTLFGFGIGWTHCRNLSMAENVITVLPSRPRSKEHGNYEQGMSRLFTLFLRKKYYDSYAFRNWHGDIEPEINEYDEYLVPVPDDYKAKLGE
ncbi:MAG: PhoH family protein [Clostridiales bacterium]|jgi:hypothetical protein|nr:PhoH family protein [Clostridiales bacterium]